MCACRQTRLRTSRLRCASASSSSSSYPSAPSAASFGGSLLTILTKESISAHINGAAHVENSNVARKNVIISPTSARAHSRTPHRQTHTRCYSLKITTSILDLEKARLIPEFGTSQNSREGRAARRRVNFLATEFCHEAPVWIAILPCPRETRSRKDLIHQIRIPCSASGTSSRDKLRKRQNALPGQRCVMACCAFSS